ncbi:hypothetical protein [Actinoplanes sp. NPDC026619]|uniref:hypothetical protein n=1 Tax=Actinoplanes sp. NPDC026619 TaxID=3155798 RepID=UPI0033EA970D
MTNLRGTVVTATIAGLLGLGLTGCADSTNTSGADGAGATTATSAPADAKTALLASTKELKTGNYAFAVASPGASGSGLVHLPSKSAKLSLGVESEQIKMKFEIVLADSDRWARMSTGTKKSLLAEGESADTWFHFDSSKLDKDTDLGIDVDDPDVVDIDAMLPAVTDVKGDGKTFTGTLDGTKVTSADAFLDADTIKQMGAAAAKLPFTATVDDQGRITKLEIDAPVAGDTAAGKWTFTISGYGEQKALTKPAGTVKELPASSYSFLNG